MYVSNILLYMSHICKDTCSALFCPQAVSLVLSSSDCHDVWFYGSSTFSLQLFLIKNCSKMGNEPTRSASSGSLDLPPELMDPKNPKRVKYEDIQIYTNTQDAWDRFVIKSEELHENTVRETERKHEILDAQKKHEILVAQKEQLKILVAQKKREILDAQQKQLEILVAQKTHHENTLYEKNIEHALKLRDKTNNEETLKKEFDAFWQLSVQKIIRDTPLIRDIDIMRDVRKILSDIYESVPVDHWRESRDILSASSYSDYVIFKKIEKRGTGGSTSERTYTPENQTEISSLVTDVVQQTDTMIQSFNISNLGYNKNYIQLLTDYIKTRVIQHQEGAVQYVFKNEFFIDLVVSICKKANKMITDQHRLFREASDPVIFVEKKREEYYSIFQKYCLGVTSAVIFGEIICQKLKEPIEQSVYKKTARDLADEMRSNCESLSGNRSKLEKHILKTLAEEEDFKKYMNYIHNPRDHFKSFIRDEVSRYITDKFSVSVLTKMKENIKLLQQKIMKAAHESTKHVQVNRGDAGLWLKSFTEQLSDVLIFSEKDLSGVKHHDADDFNLLEDVIRQELPAIMSDISKFNRATFDEKLDLKDRPDQIFIDHFCQCCWVQCPFCGAICTNTIEGHNEDNSVPFHRVLGMKGMFYKRTTNLSVQICTSAVVSYGYFYPNDSDDKILWREYRKAGGRYADWSITPDVSDLPYWKWFVCRFQKDLEKYYEKTFEGHGKIPDEWGNHSKQDAIESLDKYIY